MVQLRVLSGKLAGVLWGARQFPVRVGRSSNSDLQLEEDGVWDSHLAIDFRAAEGFVLQSQAGALTWVNEESTDQTTLRNGDIIALGSVRLQFWIGEARQTALGLREALTWAGILAVAITQFLVLGWLLINAGSALRP